MICPVCQKELDDGTLKCPFCDADLSSDEKAVLAPAEEEPCDESTTENAEAESVVICDQDALKQEKQAEEVNEEAEATETTEITETEAEVQEPEPKFQTSEEFFKKYDLFDTERQFTPRPERVYTKKAKRKSNKGLLIIIAITVAVVLSIAVGVVFLIKGLDKNSGEESSSSGSNTVDTSSVSDASSETDNVSEPDSKLDNKTIVGDWEFTISVNEMNAIGNSEAPFESDAEYKLLLRLGEDKTVQLICSVDDYKATYEAYMEDYFTYLRNGGYYEIREKEGYSKEQTDKMLADTGMTVDLLVDDLREKMQSNDATADKKLTDDGYILFTDSEKITKYTLEKGKLVFVTDEDLTRETYISFEYELGVITVNDGTYADGKLIGKSLTKK